MTEVKIKCPRCKNVFTPDKNFISSSPQISEKAQELHQAEIEKIKKDFDLEKEHLILLLPYLLFFVFVSPSVKLFF